MNYYDIIYKRKSDSTEKKWEELSEDEINEALIQLKNMASSFNGDIVLGINDLDYFEIEEKNYAYKLDGEYYLKEYVIPPTEKEYYPIHTSVSELKKMGKEELIPEIFTKKNVTNKLLEKFEIIGNSKKYQGKVFFEDNIIIANGYEFKLMDKKHIGELFDLLFRAKAYYNRLSFDYSELKEIYKNSEYEELQAYDLNKDSVNDIVGKKLKSIEDKTKIGKKILQVTTDKISIRHKTAL